MKILIATDGSDFSKEAVLLACQTLIQPAKTEVKVVSVFQPYISTDPLTQSAAYSQDFVNAMQSIAETSTTEAVSAIQHYFPNDKINLTFLVKSGIADQVIIEVAQEWNADVIVVGSHGRGFWGRVMVGSVSDSLVHHAPCSVVVVRKKTEKPIN